MAASDRGRSRAARALPLATLLLAGCVGGPAPRDHFYRPAAPSPSTQATQPGLRGVLEVERPRADALTRERSILHVESAGSVQVTPYTYQLWIDTPTVLVQRDLAEYLRQAGVAERVVLPEMHVAGDFELSSWIEQLVHVTDANQVVVEIEFSLARTRSGAQILSRRYRADQPVQGSSMDDVVRAFSAALAQIYARLAEDLASRAG